MKFSKLNEEERKWFSNESCKTRQKVHVGFSKNFTPLEKELIAYMEQYDALQNLKKKICDKYLNKSK